MKKFSIALDTCVGSGSLAVYENEERVYSRIGFLGRASEVTPLEALESALFEKDLEIKGLEELFLTRGPGSFTGVRTGLSIARGLREAMDLTVRTCTVFEALSVVGAERPFLTAVFAGSREVACQVWPEAPDGEGNKPSEGSKILAHSGLKDFLDEIDVRKMIAEPRCYAALDVERLASDGFVVLSSGDDVAALARRFILDPHTYESGYNLEAVYTREFAPGG